MALLLTYQRAAQDDLVEAGRVYGHSLKSELNDWLHQVLDTLSGAAPERPGPARSRPFRVSHSWWKPSDASVGNALRGFLYALRHPAPPYELWVTERNFSLSRRSELGLHALLLVDRLHHRVEVMRIEGLSSQPVEANPPVEANSPAKPTRALAERTDWKELNSKRVHLIDKKSSTGLTAAESLELERLQHLTSELLDRELPLPRLKPEDLDIVRHAVSIKAQDQR